MWLKRAFCHLCYFFAASLLVSSTTRAVLVNRTIDDTYGDCETGQKPTYLPSGSVWQGTSCANCAFQPNPALAFDHTWTSAMYNPALQNVNMTLQFTGVAIWVFFILPESDAVGGTSNTQCNFTLDGKPSGNFVDEPKFMNNMETPLAYNFTVFNAAGLSNQQHELVISTSGVPNSVFLNFDYAIYTADTTDNATSTTPTSAQSTSARSTSSLVSADSAIPAVPPSRTSSSNTLGIIVGCALGGIALILLVFLILFFRHLGQARADQALVARDLVSNHLPTEGFRDDMAEIYSTSDYPSQSPILSPFSDRSPSTDVANNLAPLVPVRNHQSYQPLSKSQEELRAARQTMISQRLQSTQLEINNLTSRQVSHASSDGSGRQEGTEQEMVSIREQLRQLRTQMDSIRTERQSDWALGLSNEPPPAYA